MYFSQDGSIHPAGSNDDDEETDEDENTSHGDDYDTVDKNANVI